MANSFLVSKDSSEIQSCIDLTKMDLIVNITKNIIDVW